MMKLLYVLALCLLLQACGGGARAVPEEPQVQLPDSCAVGAQRESLRGYMADKYYWYSQLRAANEQATSLDAYFQSMLNVPLDRYSFTQTTESFNQVFTTGKRIG